MDDTPEKIKRHYQRQSLPADAAERILALGRAAAQRPTRRRAFVWAAAAAILVLGGGVFAWKTTRPPPLDTGDVETAMRDFFEKPGYTVAHVSPDLAELKKWLEAAGAPTATAVPTRIANLPVYGCHVLQVKRHAVYLLCFFADTAGNGEAAAMMKKKAMLSTATVPGGTNAAAPLLVHLVAVPSANFKNAPASGTPPQLSSQGTWRFAEWRRGDITYIAGGAVQETLLRELTALL